MISAKSEQASLYCKMGKCVSKNKPLNDDPKGKFSPHPESKARKINNAEEIESNFAKQAQKKQMVTSKEENKENPGIKIESVTPGMIEEHLRTKGGPDSD
jgi:hypothetical protein